MSTAKDTTRISKILTLAQIMGRAWPKATEASQRKSAHGGVMLRSEIGGVCTLAFSGTISPSIPLRI